MAVFKSLPDIADSDFQDVKAQCVKVLEEASELCEAAKVHAKNYVHEYGSLNYTTCHRIDMLDELADVYQALDNFKHMMRVIDGEMEAAARRCDERNRERGRL